jgi:hypothetical protein
LEADYGTVRLGIPILTRSLYSLENDGCLFTLLLDVGICKLLVPVGALPGLNPPFSAALAFELLMLMIMLLLMVVLPF